MATYTPLESIVLTSAAASVTFSNISQNYQDLVLVAQCGVSTTNYLQIQLNSDTTMTNYSATWMEGDGSSASSGRYSGATGGYNLGGATTNTTLENISTIHFQNYANSTTYKSWLVRNDRASRSAHTAVGLWRNTSSINSILIKPFNSAYNLVAGSTFDLYAISPAAANTAQASGGTEIIYTNTHVIHVFKASGTFTPTRNLTADYLVVAGGGGGGSLVTDSNYASGGGGAGGVRSTVSATGGGGSLESALSLTANTAYTVTVGAGGATNAQGTNSVFSTITSTGGGFGGRATTSPSAGGSGGGARYLQTGGAASPSGQGFPGGSWTGGGGVEGGGAGGGGATSAGGDRASGTAPTTGGNAASNSISGSSQSYGGGGGGGAWSGSGTLTGAAGGTNAGQGGSVSSGVNGAGGTGTTNTGGGGGGAAGGGSGTPNGGSGGSGIVIVRYAR